MRQNIPIFFLLILSVLLLLHAGDAADLSDPLHVFSFTGLRGDLSGSGGGGAAMKLRGGSIGDCLGCLWPKPDEGKLVNDVSEKDSGFSLSAVTLSIFARALTSWAFSDP